MIVLAIGGNCGAVYDNIMCAITMLPMRVESISYVYKSKGLMPFDASAEWNIPFLNLVVLGYSYLVAESFLHVAHDIERKFGRIRHGKWAPRTLDIDLIFYDHLIKKTPTLTLPHPQMEYRDFVVVPMCDVCPRMVHPVNKRNVQKMAENLPEYNLFKVT